MKVPIRLIALALGLGSCFAVTSCSGSYTDPETGEEKKFDEPDPSTEAEKAAAYKKLEDAKAENEKWRRYAVEHNNTALVASIDENLEKIADAKEDLGYTPPKQEGQIFSNGVSTV